MCVFVHVRVCEWTEAEGWGHCAIDQFDVHIYSLVPSTLHPSYLQNSPTKAEFPPGNNTRKTWVEPVKEKPTPCAKFTTAWTKSNLNCVTGKTCETTDRL